MYIEKIGFSGWMPRPLKNTKPFVDPAMVQRA